MIATIGVTNVAATVAEATSMASLYFKLSFLELSPFDAILVN